MLDPRDIDIIVLALKATKDTLESDDEVIKDIDRIIKDFGYDLD